MVLGVGAVTAAIAITHSSKDNNFQREENSSLSYLLREQVISWRVYAAAVGRERERERERSKRRTTITNTQHQLFSSEARKLKATWRTTSRLARSTQPSLNYLWESSAGRRCYNTVDVDCISRSHFLSAHCLLVSYSVGLRLKKRQTIYRLNYFSLASKHVKSTMENCLMKNPLVIPYSYSF